MGSSDKMGCDCLDTSGMERLRYFPRQLLTADDMRAEQEYFREKMRRHNRLLHGTGTVCGLEVVASGGTNPLEVLVCPGYALGRFGDDIYVPEPAPLGLEACTRPLPAPCSPEGTAIPAGTGGETILKLLVQIRYVECMTRPARTLPAGCGCDESACEYSRIRDGYQLRCVRDTTKSEEAASPGICEMETGKAPKPPKCLPCPDDPWLTLARVTFPAGSISSVTNAMIDNKVRKMVYATATIQQSLIDRCCQ